MESIRTAEKKEDFLTALASCGNVTEACRIADVSRNAMYMWKNEEPDFAEQWKVYLAAGAELLEDEAIRRAREGYDEPVFHQGAIVGKVRKYSDTLLIFLLKGQMKDKYGDKLQTTVTPIESLSEDQLREKLAGMLNEQVATDRSDPNS